ncbi:MAG: D-sedoheptulose 7-phosphate isomerase [Desulfovibrio sp.]|nr:D-sedoheptulose 7-phosphate isomerase [Desulfovibrio sp.]
MQNFIEKQISCNIELFQSMARDKALIALIAVVAERCVFALKNGRKLLFMGNGGSAGDAQHLAGEMVSRFAYDRPGLPAFALTTDSSVLTAIGNDYGYEQLFSRQVQSVGQSGDVLFGISTSGNSPNVIKALELGRRMGLLAVGLTGNHEAQISRVTDFCLKIPSTVTPKIQEGHICVGHILCGIIEASIFPVAKADPLEGNR